MGAVEKIITDNLLLWSSSVQLKSTQGRGSSSKRDLYGVKKLRELILDFAFKGLLVKSVTDADDKQNLLLSMQKEREDFHKEKGVKLQELKISESIAMEISYPPTWNIFYFGEVIIYITDFQANGSFATLKANVEYYDSKNYAMLLRLTDLRKNLTDTENFKYTDKSGYDFLYKSKVLGGEVVVANVGAGVGTTLHIPEITMPTTLAPNMFMVMLPKTLNKEYFLYYSKSPSYHRYIETVNSGTGQPKINKTEYKNCKIPIPPLAEQHRIVAKVDELMALCDTLEQQQEDSIQAHETLVETLLNVLTNAPDAEAFQSAWQRVSKHFDTLLTTEHSVDKLKETILQLAVMGKLVPQDPNDEPASVLLEKIADEKEQLIKDGKIKRKRRPTLDDNLAVPFKLPIGWALSNLSDIGHDWGQKKPDKKFTYIDVGSINKELGVIEEQNVLDKDEAPSRARKIVKYGTVIYSTVRPYLLNIAVVDRDFTPEPIASTAFAIIHPFKGMEPSYIYSYLRSPIFVSYVESCQTGIAYPAINDKQFFSGIIAVPPLAEQHRIVAKVDELMALCDDLKQSLNDAQTTQMQLTDAVTEQAVN
jgi:type I restriction enzyme, S subunit